MVNPTDAGFAKFAGQSVASGIDTGRSMVALEAPMNETTFKNLDKINGLLPKISDTIIFETRVFNSPLERITNRIDARLGAATEMAMFTEGAVNKKLDGTCIPRGKVTMESALLMQNHSWSIDIDIADNEISRAALNDSVIGSYTANKMRSAAKQEAQLAYKKTLAIISDVIDGTRTVASTTASDGSGASVTYSVDNISGYAGKVDVMDDVKVAPIEVGSEADISAADAIAILNRLKAVAADFKFETDAYNKLGADTFTLDKPNLIMEVKVLDAADAAFAKFNLSNSDTFGYAGFPTRSFREVVSEFATLCEIDSFMSLPVNPEYNGLRLLCVLADPDCLWRIDHWANVESARCHKKRLTGYNWQGDATIGMWRGANSYALLVDADETDTFAVTFKDSAEQGGAVLGVVRANEDEPVVFTKVPPAAPAGKVFDAYMSGDVEFVSGTTTVEADTVFTATYTDAS